MTALATVPVAAVVPISTASAFTADRSRWERAVRDLRIVQVDFDKLSAEHTAAFDAAEELCPDNREFFNRYNLGRYKNKAAGRERNYRWALMTIVTERVNAKGASLSSPEAKEAAAEADRVVSGFDDWCRRRDEAHAHYDCDKLEERFSAASDRLFEAKEAVLKLPAPDAAGLLLKFEILTDMMNGEQDLHRVEWLQADARRLALQ